MVEIEGGDKVRRRKKRRMSTEKKRRRKIRTKEGVRIRREVHRKEA